jgi:hypothetical protein
LLRGQKGRFSTEDGVQENPKRPNISGFAAVLFPSKDLWRRVLDRALKLIKEGLVRIHNRGRAKVDQFDMELVIHNNVLTSMSSRLL